MLRLALFTLAVLVGSLAVACGADPESPTPSATQTSTAPTSAPDVVDVQIGDLTIVLNLGGIVRVRPLNADFQLRRPETELFGLCYARDQASGIGVQIVSVRKREE